jgi:hypothetical protein
MHDRFKKRFQVPGATGRVRRQIAVEAARRMLAVIGPEPGDASGRLREASEAEYYTAKRKAAAVLGHRVRPGDLPSDAEVRAEVLTLARSKGRSDEQSADETDHDHEPGEVAVMSDHVDRFAIYRMRLLPLESVKQSPKHHPEGDALYHSLQVFERAREARPYDEEFLLAALLHEVGKAIDPSESVGAAVEALRGAVTDRTLWLIEHHADQPTSAKPRKFEASAEELEDLALLREVDDLGRVPGAPVGTVDEALAYLKALEDEHDQGDESP